MIDNAEFDQAFQTRTLANRECTARWASGRIEQNRVNGNLTCHITPHTQINANLGSVGLSPPLSKLTSVGTTCRRICAKSHAF